MTASSLSQLGSVTGSISGSIVIDPIRKTKWSSSRIDRDDENNENDEDDEDEDIWLDDAEDEY